MVWFIALTVYFGLPAILIFILLQKFSRPIQSQSSTNPSKSPQKLNRIGHGISGTPQSYLKEHIYHINVQKAFD